MNIIAARATLGLTAVAETTGTETVGQLAIGPASAETSLLPCDVAYSLRARLVNAAALVLVVGTNTTSGSTAWVAGSAQVETATVIAAGGITASGTVIATVTAAGMTGSPKAIPVTVTLAAHTTAALIATVIASTLNADTAFAAMFLATSSGADVIVTGKASSLGFFRATDGTLNIGLANGTATGVTTAPTSANTTAGAASTGALISDGDAKDVEGITIPTITVLKGLAIKCTSGDVDLTSAAETATLTTGETRIIAGTNLASLLATLTFTAGADSDLTITVIGATA